MRMTRLLMASAMAWLVATAFAVAPMAQAKITEEDYDKVMKAVGQTAGSLRKNAEAQNTDGVSADAKKMAGLFKDANTFWTQQNNKEAADWAKGAMDHATEIDKAAAAKNMAGVGEHTKLMMGACQTCHAKYRDRAADGSYSIKKP
jgi:cytochrome c556